MRHIDPMKKLIVRIGLVFFCGLFLLAPIAAFNGCSTSATTTAVNADAVVISGVNAAMTAWASEVNAGKANATQIASVSNAYAAYYNSQLTVSNLAAAYVASPSTNLSTAITTAEQALALSATNIVQIINTFSK